MQPSKNTSSADSNSVVSRARNLADNVGLGIALSKASVVAGDAALEQSISKASRLVEQLTSIEVKLLPIEKKADEEQIVLGIVLEPGTFDAHNDTISADTIAKAAHEWLAKFQNRGLMHDKLINGKILIYESYIAPVAFTIGGQKVKKGSWLLMYKVLDKKIWKKIKDGELTGFSMGGVGKRVKL